jgi:WD40 repeat protein
VTGLVSEIYRDLSTAPASLPLLQYILTELFERRVEDRLTVQAYRTLGGVQGVLERQAEAAYNSLPADATSTCRQLFLRMVQLGDHGEETRRRVARTELSGLGERQAMDEVIGAFTTARILTSDRDPVSRVPTIEISHETVITRWTRFRVWIDESRADLTAQRRLAIAADTWTRSGEDPEYLLTGGPMAAVVELTESRRASLNETEARFVEASRAAAAEAEAREQERQRREADLEHRSRRRLALGIGTAMIAAVVAVLAGFAWFERQRANDLAAVQERQSTARELAAASIANLDSADPDLSLLLAIEAAELSVEAGEEVLSEVVEALHRAVIRVRPVLTIDDALRDTHGEGLSYSGTGSLLAYVTDEGTVAVIDLGSGSEVFRTSRIDPPAFGVDFHPSGSRFMSIHRDGVREWTVGMSEMLRWIPHHPAAVSTATFSDDGRLVAIGDDTGTITVYEGPGEVIATLSGEHNGPVNSVDFDPAGRRLVSAGSDPRVLVWDLESGVVITKPQLRTDSCAYEAAWHPQHEEKVATLCNGDAFAFDAETGQRLRPFSHSNQVHAAMVHDISGLAVAGAGSDGIARIFNYGLGGSSIFDLPNGGAPLGDIEFNPLDPASLEVAALGLDGTIQIWRDGAAWSELPHHFTLLREPFIEATPDGRRYVVGSNNHIPGVAHCDEEANVLLVIDAATETVLAAHKTLCTAGQLHRGAIADDGKFVAATGPSGNVFVLDVDTGASTEIPESASWSLDLDFSSDGRLLAGVGLDGLIVVWDLESMSRVITMSSGPEDLGSAQQLLPDRAFVQIAFRPGSNELVTAGFDGSIRAWDLDDGGNRTLHTFDSSLSSIDISPDGASVAGSDTTGDVRLLDSDTGEEILPRPQTVAGGTSVVFSPDGHLLAGGGPGPVIYLWDLRSGEIHRRLGRSFGRPTVAFVNGGAEIRAASLEGIVRGYVLDPIELLGIAREKAGREMTDEECERYLRRACE